MLITYLWQRDCHTLSFVYIIIAKNLMLISRFFIVVYRKCRSTSLFDYHAQQHYHAFVFSEFICLFWKFDNVSVINFGDTHFENSRNYTNKQYCLVGSLIITAWYELRYSTDIMDEIVEHRWNINFSLNMKKNAHISFGA